MVFKAMILSKIRKAMNELERREMRIVRKKPYGPLTLRVDEEELS